MAEPTDHRSDPLDSRPLPNRRAALRIAAAGLGAAWSGRAFALPGLEDDDPPAGLIVRNARPLDAESPLSAFTSWKTPNDQFFVRSHFGAPAVTLRPWTIAVRGLVERSLKLTLEELDGFERVTIPAVLQCAGNGRGLFRPNIAGVGWGRGAVGNAEWSGVRLADLLGQAGVKPEAAHVHLIGSDAPPNSRTPPFLRSIPLDRALDPSTLVATHMNGEPLPRLHGGPLRLVVPTWTGNHWMKWLAAVSVEEGEAPGFYQQTGYRIPRVPTPPGVNVPPEGLVPVTVMNVKSLIARPSADAVLKAGDHAIRGVAWTGPGRVTRVQVSVDDGPWQLAKLGGPDVEGSWRTWELAWKATPGRHAIRARATDSSNQTQPDTPPWNKSGYLWNGIETVSVDVR